MHTYKQDQGKLKRKTLKGSNAKIQTQATMGGEGAKEVAKELKELFEGKAS
jgi:hypothetical protein